jgi:3-deoxy-manno-octulosonate cytidylyltransferase (CMP-KDO synthetase)
MKLIGVIPARYASTRFPGKPLVDIQGKSMIQRVYEQAKKTDLLERVIVATDDQRIKKAVERFGGEVAITSLEHPSGTDRCNEVLQKLKAQGERPDAIINIQGDEPFIQPAQIDLLCSCFRNQDVFIATLAKKIASLEELFSNTINKVLIDRNGNALYFSRTAIPHLKNIPEGDWLNYFAFLKHIGIYGYRSETLEAITRLSPSPLEKAESLEQLRWLENGYTIHVEETTMDSISVDTPEDLSKFLNSP